MLIYKEPSVEETSGAIVFYGTDCEVLKYVKIDKSSAFTFCKMLDVKPNKFYTYNHIIYTILSSIGIDLTDDNDIRSIIIIDFQELNHLSAEHVKFFDFNDETKSFMKKIDLKNIDTMVTKIMDCLDEFRANYDRYIALAMTNADNFNAKVDYLRTIKKLLGSTAQVNDIDIPDKIGKEINHA